MSTVPYKAPVETSLELVGDGVITSPAWLAWLNRIVTPALQELISNLDPPSVPLELGKDRPQASDGSGLILGSLPASIARGARDDQGALNLPLPAHRLAYDSPGFPPGAPQAVPRETLTLAAAIQFGRSLPIWIISDTAANIAIYPPSAYPVNALFLATDTGNLYQNSGTTWVLFAVLSQSITTPTVALQINGSASGISQTSACSCVRTGKQALLVISVTLTNKGAGTGPVTLALGTIPAVAGAGIGAVSALANMLLLSGSVDAYLAASSSTVVLNLTGATGSTPLADTNLTNTSTFKLSLIYETT